ncbi:MAG: ABC transporter substrate-binding protein [Proteobacteria bacterium]|nr:ABC transporter substrate-binding protein [Pseudomonadota bacterium]
MIAFLLSIFLAQGVSDVSIVIGMEGPANSFSVNEENLGMRLVIRHTNATGGVHGRQLIPATRSRGSDDPVEQQITNARLLVEEDDAFLLFNFGGPASVQIGDYAMKNDVPYLFPHTALLTVDGDRHVFTSYPRYEGESRAMLTYLSRDRGIDRIAIIHAPNIYGEYFAGRAKSLADDLDYHFVGAQALASNAGSATAEMAHLKTLKPDAVVMALYPEGARKVVEAKAALDWNVPLVSSGPLTDEQYLNIAGGRAEGTLGFCHYPDPNESDAPGVATYRKLMAEYFPGHELNRYSLYGYVFGRLVIEGLERAGRDLTRNAFLDGMESIRGWDSGGILPPVSFSRTDHHAQDAGFICELEDGRFKPLTDWLAP